MALRRPFISNPATKCFLPSSDGGFQAACILLEPWGPELAGFQAKWGICGMLRGACMYVSPPVSSGTPGVFYPYFYNHARRLRLKKLLCLVLSRISNGYFKSLLDPGGGFTSETAARRLQKRNGRYVSVPEVKRLHTNLQRLYVTAIPQRTQVFVRV